LKVNVKFTEEQYAANTKINTAGKRPPHPLQSAAKFGTSTFAPSGDPKRTGWRDDFSGLFKDKRGKLKAPNSCIQSPEFIIQSIARKKRSFPQNNYVTGQVNVPHVVAYFETEIVNATIKNKKPEEVRNALQKYDWSSHQHQYQQKSTKCRGRRVA
jgi:hypothetical protein